MSDEKAGHVAVLLNDGKVMVMGGTSGSLPPTYFSSAEVYDPVSDSWTSKSALNTARVAAAATVLLDGRVLVTGGYTSGLLALSSAEIYDPDTDAWSSAGSMSTSRVGHKQILLDDGRILVAGGEDSLLGPPNTPTTTEIYDPTTNTWSLSGDLNVGRFASGLAKLDDGKVLAAGGFSYGPYGVINRYTSEIYNPKGEVTYASEQMAAVYQLIDMSAFSSNKASPYLVTPGDKLVLAVSKTRPAISASVIDIPDAVWPGGDGVMKYADVGANVMQSYIPATGSVDGHDVTLQTGYVNITLYGSYVQGGKSYIP